MEDLQVREKEIFETLKKIKGYDFVVIGGYAVNAYTLPRFSVDCDIVVKDSVELKKISKELEKTGYVKKEENKIQAPYTGEFLRYEKEIRKNFSVSIDILIGVVFDRQTNVKFSAGWIFKNSKNRMLKGKTISENLKLMVIDIDALMVMKFISSRNTDIRDIFMLVDKLEDPFKVVKEINSFHNFNQNFLKIKQIITSKDFKNNLQGVFGYIDIKIFDKHKKKFLGLNKYLKP